MANKIIRTVTIDGREYTVERVHHSHYDDYRALKRCFGMWWISKRQRLGAYSTRLGICAKFATQGRYKERVVPDEDIDAEINKQHDAWTSFTASRQKLKAETDARNALHAAASGMRDAIRKAVPYIRNEMEIATGTDAAHELKIALDILSHSVEGLE